MRYRGLCADLEGDRGESTAETLQDLCKHDFDGRSIGTPGVNHHCDATGEGYQYRTIVVPRMNGHEAYDEAKYQDILGT